MTIQGGLYTSCITPFGSDGSVDLRVNAEFLRRQMASGVEAFLTNGSMGEFLSLSIEDRCRITENTIDTCGASAAVMVGINSFDFDEVVTLGQHAKSVGAESVLVAPLTYWQMSEREIEHYYARLLDTLDIPVVAYNTPKKTSATDITSQLMGRLSVEHGLAGVKESTYDPKRIEQILAVAADGFSVFCGDDYGLVQAASLGAAGWIAGVSAVLPSECVELCSLVWDDNDYAGARLAQRELNRVSQSIYAGESNPIAATRRGIELTSGLVFGDPREPLLPLSAERREAVGRILDGAGLSRKD